MSMGDEIYAVNNTRNGNAFAEAEQLTFENKQIYDKLEMGKVEARWMTTTDGKQMLTWVIYPPQFDPNKKYQMCIRDSLTYVPYLAAAGELKTKPTQHSVKELQSAGIQPDVLVLRTCLLYTSRCV